MKRTTDRKIRDFITARNVVPLLIAIYKGGSNEEMKDLITKLRELGEASEVLIADMEEVRGSYKERVYKAAEED